jgi:mono/diheme cytochrome c family protein
MKPLLARILLATGGALSLIPAFGAEGEQLYLQRCAACHNSGQTGIPPRSQLASRPKEFIIDKLMLGSMQSQTLGLSEAQIALIASYLIQPGLSETGKATP